MSPSKEYISFRCLTCGKTTILLLHEIQQSQSHGRYITCGHDGRHARLVETGQYDNLRECMEDQRTYKHERGIVKETK